MINLNLIEWEAETKKTLLRWETHFLHLVLLYFIEKKCQRLSEQQKMCNFFHKHTSMLCFLIVVDRTLHYALKESFYVYLYCLYRFGDLFYELPEGNVFF